MWLARDEKRLFLYIGDKPVLKSEVYEDSESNEWFPANDQGCIELPEEMFPEITFNTGPVEVYLKKYNN